MVFIMAQKKIQKHIEIVCSSKLGLSSMGRKSRNAAHDLLQSHYATVGISIVNNLDDLDQVIAKQPDLVFLGSKYVPGAMPNTKIWISEYLDRHNIEHTGSSANAIKLEQNKSLAKQRILDAGIQTSPYAVVASGETFENRNDSLHFPMFVKPVDLGAGRGVDTQSIVNTIDELHAKVAALAERYSADALIEEFLPGREYSVAILKEEDSASLIAMPLELLPAPDINGHRILSHELKSAALETPVAPVTDPVIRTALVEIATRAFEALGARDYGRIDIRMDESGIAHFLEANLIPCLIEGSGNFPKACLMNIGMDYETMMLHIVDLALAHQQDTPTYEPKPLHGLRPANTPIPA